jgi:hypothetical protein
MIHGAKKTPAEEYFDDLGGFFGAARVFFYSFIKLLAK